MKYKVGDKVRIRKDLVMGEKYGKLTYFDTMKQEIEEKGEIAIITNARIDCCGIVGYDFDGFTFTYSEEMIEGLFEDKELDKFEGFLREVADQNALNYGSQWNCLNDLMHGRINPKEAIAELVEFYKTFEPPTVKKLTMAELREIVGEDFEIVD